jgi:hypothetical protein
MEMTKVTTTPEIKKQIRISESWLGRDGLELLFYIDGKELFYQFDQLRTAKILKACGLISDYKTGVFTGNNFIMIETEFCHDDCDLSGEPRQTVGKIVQSWDDFVASFSISQYDAICITAAIVREQRLQEAANEIINTVRCKYQAQDEEKYYATWLQLAEDCERLNEAGAI